MPSSLIEIPIQTHKIKEANSQHTTGTTSGGVAGKDINLKDLET